MLIIAYIVCFILWAMFTWGLLIATIEAFRQKQIWNTIYCGIGFLAALFVFIGGIYKNVIVPVTEPDKVYICTGSHSHAYHTKKRCKGLRSCSKSIRTISFEEAEKMGRTPCRFCCDAEKLNQLQQSSAHKHLQNKK